MQDSYVDTRMHRIENSEHFKKKFTILAQVQQKL